MMWSPVRQQVEALGAVWTEVAGRNVPQHFGDGAAEYHTVRQNVGIVDRSDQAQIRMWGREPVKMVQGLITNDLAGAPPNRGVYATMLTPKGRTVAELRAFRRDGPGGLEVLLDLPREALEGTREHLKKFIPPLFARWTDVSETFGCIGVYGPNSRVLVSRVLTLELPELAEDGYMDTSFGSEPLLVVHSLYTGLEEGYDLFGAATSLPALWDALLAQGVDLEAMPVGFGALETLRIEAGRPRYGQELTEGIIPTEAFEASGLLPRVISFDKGCYTGQEVIVRIAHRGHVNRHLRGLLLGDAPVPAPRTRLHHPESGKEIGWTASAAVSPLLEQTIALAYVRREIAPGNPVRLESAEGAEAIVAALPFARSSRKE